jgi:3-oxoacyl-[acyl-carrier protein] reductase
MKAKGKGVVINTSSVAAFNAHHGFAAYISSKHAMNGLTKSMAWELGPEIRVNAIAPGAVHTAMVDSIGGVDVLRAMIDGCPMKRVGQPEDIASVALFLASDDSSFIDGQIIRVDGGVEV